MWVQEVCFDKQTLSDYVVFIDSNVCINIFIDNNILFLFQQPGLSRHIVVIQPFIPCTPVFHVKLKLEVKFALRIIISISISVLTQSGRKPSVPAMATKWLPPRTSTFGKMFANAFQTSLYAICHSLFNLLSGVVRCMINIWSHSLFHSASSGTTHFW
jgi:hypothetical protein